MACSNGAAFDPGSGRYCRGGHAIADAATAHEAPPFFRTPNACMACGAHLLVDLDVLRGELAQGTQGARVLVVHLVGVLDARTLPGAGQPPRLPALSAPLPLKPAPLKGVAAPWERAWCAAR